MGWEVRHLPRQFPVGTRYVIEGRNGRIRLRYLEFPDGRHVDLPVDAATRVAALTALPARAARPRPAKKNLLRHGTPRAKAS